MNPALAALGRPRHVPNPQYGLTSIMNSRPSICWQAVDHGLAVYRASLDWAERTIADLRRPADGPGS